MLDWKGGRGEGNYKAVEVVEDGYHDQVVVVYAGRGGDGLVGEPCGFALGQARVADSVELLPPAVYLGSWKAGEETVWVERGFEGLELVADLVLYWSCMYVLVSSVSA